MDEKLLKTALIKINSSFKERQEQLQARLAIIFSDGVKHGTLNSTVTFQRAEAACVVEMRARARNAWAIFREVVEAFRIGISPVFAEELKSEIRGCLYPSLTELDQTLWGTPGRELMPIGAIKSLAQVMEETLSEVGANVDLYTASPRPKRTIKRSTKGTLFLSHAASDAAIAMLLKEEFDKRIPGLAIFCSSDPTDLPPGSKWSLEIQDALERSSALILIASQRSLKRPWVWFECGTFWFKGRPIIPLCLGEIRKEMLRPPLSELQALNGDEPEDLRILLETMSSAAQLRLLDTETIHSLAATLRRLNDEAKT